MRRVLASGRWASMLIATALVCECGGPDQRAEPAASSPATPGSSSSMVESSSSGKSASCANREISDADRPSATSGFAESEGLCIYYELHGTGQPLVVVHGWSSSIRFGWVDTGWMEALTDAGQVVAIDIRGHGNSDKPHDQRRYSYNAMAQDVHGPSGNRQRAPGSGSDTHSPRRLT